MIKIEPQPRCGPPFRIAFANRDASYWYNERRQWLEAGRGPMLFEWKCPYGKNGQPVLVDSVWYWQQVTTSVTEAESFKKVA